MRGDRASVRGVHTQVQITGLVLYFVCVGKMRGNFPQAVDRWCTEAAWCCTPPVNCSKVKSMDDNCGEWVECIGVVSRSRVWLVGVGGIYGCG